MIKISFFIFNFIFITDYLLYFFNPFIHFLIIHQFNLIYLLNCDIFWIFTFRFILIYNGPWVQGLVLVRIVTGTYFKNINKLSWCKKRKIVFLTNITKILILLNYHLDILTNYLKRISGLLDRFYSFMFL